MPLVYVCDPGNEGTARAQQGLLGQTDPFPTCANGGAWLTMEDAVSQGMEFQLSQLDPAVLSAAFGSGFIIIATAFVIGRPIAALLGIIRR